MKSEHKPISVYCSEEWQRGFLLGFFKDCTNPSVVANESDRRWATFRKVGEQVTFYESAQIGGMEERTEMTFEEFFGGAIECASLVRQYKDALDSEKGEE